MTTPIFETMEQLLDWTAKTAKQAEHDAMIARMCGQSGNKVLLDSIIEIREVRQAHQHLFERVYFYE
jgi:hypothetical protein